MSNLSSRPDAALFNVTKAIEDKLGDLAWAGFQVGDEFQRDIVDFVFDVATFRAFRPSYVQRLSSNLSQRAIDALRVLIPSEDTRLAFQQLRNNYEVYNLVKHVHDQLQIPAGRFKLQGFLERAYALGQYPDLWAVEGLGHDYAAPYLESDTDPTGLLLEENTGKLDDKTLPMLHAGIGLAFAQKLMNTVSPYGPPEMLRSTLERFLRLCRDNSRPGYAGAAYESLGLVTRTWHAQLVRQVDRELARLDDQARGYFWHGCGRALYFLPSHFIPGFNSPWLAVDQYTSDETARRNVVAGLAWAVTVVNLRQPEIMAYLLRYRGAFLTADDAFTNGVLSTLLMASATTPGDVYVEEFCRYGPDPGVVDTWQRTIGLACGNVTRKYCGPFEEVFHYQPIEDLMSKLC